MDKSLLQNNLDSLQYVVPEFILVGMLFANLLIGLWKNDRRLQIGLSVLLYVAVLTVLILQWPDVPVTLFGGMMRVDDFSQYFKILFAAGGLLTLGLSSRKNADQFRAEYFIMINGIVLGSFLLAMSMHLVMMLLSLELISLCSYMLVGFTRGKNGSEGSLKYFLFGSISTAVMIYGMSLVIFSSNTLDISSSAFFSNLVNQQDNLFALSTILILSGLLFKITAAPFHFWAPDVYESTDVPVIAFISTVPKLAGFSFLIKFSLAVNLFGQSHYPWASILAGISIATIIIGSLSAIGQSNAKRLMAYSSIAQSGFLLIGLAAMTLEGIHALLFYSTVFLLANFLVFRSFQFLESVNAELTITKFAGLGKSLALPSICLTIALISLTGLPPVAGFNGKIFLFSALWSHYAETGHSIDMWLLVTGLLATVISFYFYFKIPYQLFLTGHDRLESETDSKDPLSLILAILLIGLFLNPQVLLNLIAEIRFIL